MKVSLIFGTRPEAIKLCPLAKAFQAHPAFDVSVCVTAQHREMLDQVLDIFNVKPDADLNLMQPNQTLASLTSAALPALDRYLMTAKPDLVIVQGDTTTTFCAGLAAFYRGVQVAHVEAGLRTGNKLSPFPEEMNRSLTTRLADLHFVATEAARRNLVREGVAEDKIYITGNTVIDALFSVLPHVRENVSSVPGLPQDVLRNGNRMVLITGHRRESFGLGVASICGAIAKIASAFPDVNFVYPVHLNPNILGPVHELLSGTKNIYLIEPVEYLSFVYLMDRSYLVISDSGGVQEEAPSLGKPVLVTRDTTERQEGIEAGTAKLVGTSESEIVESTTRLLSDDGSYQRMARTANPYGDGTACAQILDLCEKHLTDRRVSN
jgi:UDP-N-acetylglucosamine 2-epimerase (non-hydrolysing)